MLQIVALAAIQTPVAVDAFIFILAATLPDQRRIADNACFRLLALMDEDYTPPTASANQIRLCVRSRAYRVRVKHVVNSEPVGHDLAAGAPTASRAPFAPFLVDQDR